jgi:hypothetical protein
MVRSALFLAGLVGGTALLTGCPPSAEDCQPGTFWDANTEMCVAQNNPQQCPPGQTWNGSMCMASQPMPQPQCPAGQQWNGSACVAAAPAGGACNAQPIDVSPIQPGIAAAAQQYIPAGAHPVGNVMAGNFQPGQCLEQTIQFQMGKCYTVVGAGIGPTDVDLEIVPVIPIPGIPSQAVATDQDNSSNPVIGAKPNCWTSFVPAAMKVIVRVESGQGIAGAQVYEK